MQFQFVFASRYLTMNRNFPYSKFLTVFLLLLITGKVFSSNQQKNGDGFEIPKACVHLTCGKEEQCISRKFVCKTPPCPSMVYCSKSQKESLKGPSSCNSVYCSRGYVCVVKVRHCTWDEKCKQQIARCVTEREYYEGPTSCADFQCPEGQKCILRESLCTSTPCKVLKSCAKSKDAEKWFQECKNLGCSSEYECFLRRSRRKCVNSSCKHTSDCMPHPENESDEYCQGWVCPPKQNCSAHVLTPCEHDICKIFRNCSVPSNFAKYLKSQHEKSEPKTLIDLEKDLFYHEEEKRMLQNMLTTTFTPIIDTKASLYKFGFDKTRQLFFKSGESPAGIQGHDFEFLNSARSVPHAPSVPIYKFPIYTASTVQPKHIFSPEKTTLRTITTVRSTTSSSEWLESLKSRTGLDVINVWVKKAEENKNYREFQQWLESVRETLDPEMYRLWLEEVRLTTSHSKKFQDWLPPQLPALNHNYQPSDFGAKVTDMEDEIFSAFPQPEVEERSHEVLKYPEKDFKNKGFGDFPPFNNSNNFKEILSSGKSSQLTVPEKSFQVRKSHVIPTIVFIQSSPQIFDPNIMDPQQLHHQTLEPRFVPRLEPNQILPFQLSRPVNNLINPLHFHQYLMQNHLLNSLSGHITQNLIPPNFLHQYLLFLHGLKNIHQWNRPDFAYPNFNQRHPIDVNNKIHNRKDDYFDFTNSNWNLRRSDNQGDLMAKRGHQDFYNQGHNKDQSGNKLFNRKTTSTFVKNPNFIDHEDKKNEEDLELIKQILEEIIDYDSDEKEQDGENEKNNPLFGTLIHSLKGKLDQNPGITSNSKLGILLEEIEEKSKKDIKTKNHEHRKFDQNSSDILPKQRNNEPIFQFPGNFQDRFTNQKNPDPVNSFNNDTERNQVLNLNELSDLIDNLIKLLNSRYPHLTSDISTEEIQNTEENPPKIILPMAGYYDFVKTSDFLTNQTSDKNSNSDETDIMQIRENEDERN